MDMHIINYLLKQRSVKPEDTPFALVNAFRCNKANVRTDLIKKLLKDHRCHPVEECILMGENEYEDVKILLADALVDRVVNISKST